MTAPDRRGGSPRRLVLIDFDWHDADLLPALLRMRGVSIRLVTGSTSEDAGVRVAALCGLRRSVEVADLTREIFDLALVGERSPRRPQLERLLRALGTPIESPMAFARNGDAMERRGPDETAPASPDASPENGVGGEVAGWASHGIAAAIDREAATTAEHSMPAPDDLPALERSLAGWLAATGASAASLHLARGDSLSRVCRSGPEDPLLEALVALAFRLDRPQVMTCEDGPQRGRLWAAWPFQSARRRGVVAVGGAEASGRAPWESVVRALSLAWRVAEEGESPEPPHLTLLEPDAFTHRLRLAVDRHHADGFRFALYRLTFEGPEAVLDTLLRVLPERLRGTDCVCRPAPQELLLLCAGTAHAFAHVRRRIDQLWREAWGTHGAGGDPGAIAEERVDLAGAEGAHAFLVAARDWMGDGQRS
jgi:hypothetical protein